MRLDAASFWVVTSWPSWPRVHDPYSLLVQLWGWNPCIAPEPSASRLEWTYYVVCTMICSVSTPEGTGYCCSMERLSGSHNKPWGSKAEQSKTLGRAPPQGHQLRFRGYRTNDSVWTFLGGRGGILVLNHSQSHTHTHTRCSPDDSRDGQHADCAGLKVPVAFPLRPELPNATCPLP